MGGSLVRPGPMHLVDANKGRVSRRERSPQTYPGTLPEPRLGRRSLSEPGRMAAGRAGGMGSVYARLRPEQTAGQTRAPSRFSPRVLAKRLACAFPADQPRKATNRTRLKVRLWMNSPQIQGDRR